MKELRVKYHFEHGLADNGKLEIYDAAIALKGIARASAIMTHAYLNGEIRKQGESATGAKFYINTPKRGSFIYEASIFITGAVSSGLFYDFLKYGFNEGVGIITNDNYSKSLNERIEPTIGELPAALESALDEIHRPIKQDHKIKLKVLRPRGEVLANFDIETSKYLSPITIPAPHDILGAVTKFNSISGWGKFFDDREGRTISFNILESISDYERSLVTWSLHQNNLGKNGALKLEANAIVAPTGKIKRYIVLSIKQVTT
ncbi:hypothetical protein [Shewanella baltica]|uniref:DUF7946 domain-containing protein n=1 Tax=Shewanella baltica TaxID=62322 RepID=UPI003D06596C